MSLESISGLDLIEMPSKFKPSSNLHFRVPIEPSLA
jgi:hypothetical protein